MAAQTPSEMGRRYKAKISPSSANPGGFHTTSRISVESMYPQLHGEEDESEEEEEDFEQYDISPNTRAALRLRLAATGNTPPSTKSTMKITPPPVSSKPSVPVPEDEEEADAASWLLVFTLIFTIIVALITGYHWFGYGETTISEHDMNVEELVHDLYAMSEKFPHQSAYTWATIVAGVRDLYSSQPQKPCVILLLVEEDEAGECLAERIATTVLHRRNPEASPVVMDAQQIKAADYGEALEMLREKVSNNKVLVLNNLQSLPGTLASSLHALCDRENPLVRDALLVLTMRSDQAQQQRVAGENAGTLARRVLEQAWEREVSQDKLPALITRLSSSVVVLEHEDRLPGVCRSR